jgi:hypothetical protein
MLEWAVTIALAVLTVSFALLARAHRPVPAQ